MYINKNLYQFLKIYVVHFMWLTHGVFLKYPRLAAWDGGFSASENTPYCSCSLFFLLVTSGVKVASGRFVVQAGLGHESVLHAGAQFVGADLKSVSCLN